MKYTPIENIKENDILAMSIFNDDCNILLAANSRLSATNIQRIKDLRFRGLYIYDDSTDSVNIDLLSDSVRQNTLKSLKHINIDDCLYIANTITNNIIENPGVLYELTTICSYDTRTYMHCINTALLSTMIGVDMGLSNTELYELSQSALLHDIGKTCIDERILNKDGKLTTSEYRMMQQHVNFGYNMLRNNDNISKKVAEGVKYHHENEDGSGYPCGLKSDKIPLFAKIIHVADVYDAMISKRSYKKRINPADVLEYLMGNARTLDINVVNSLTHCVALYPAGSTVMLSTGETATVIKNENGYPQRPEIKLEDGTYIKLMTTLNITITDLLI